MPTKKSKTKSKLVLRSRKTKRKTTRKPIRRMRQKVYLPKPAKGTLSKYGYKNIAETKAEKRRKALKKASKKMGSRKVLRDLVVISTLQKTNSPKTYKKMRSDVKWMRKEWGPGKYT